MRVLALFAQLPKCVFIYFYCLHIMWSWKGLDENLVLHLQANVGDQPALYHHFSDPRTPTKKKKVSLGTKGPLFICLFFYYLHFVFFFRPLSVFLSLFFFPSHFHFLSLSFCFRQFFLSSIHSSFIFLSLFFCLFFFPSI